MKLIHRAVDICLRPRRTFVAVEREKAGFTALYRDYVLWLAAVAPAARLIIALARQVDASGVAELWTRIAALSAAALLDYVCALVGVYVLALAINLLAPLFGGERDEDRALGLCAYALTPSFLASALAAFPGIGWSAILSLYAVILIIIGLPTMMHCDDDRALGYGASAAVAMAAIALVTSELTWHMLGYT